MGTVKSEAKREEEFLAEAKAMYQRLRAWRGEHREASFDEIGDQVTAERQRLMGRLVGELAMQVEEGRVEVEVCNGCGKEMRASGKRQREVSHLEGDVGIGREYHYCESCESGFFPPR